MGRYPGDLTTDVYGFNIDELKVGLIDFGSPIAADEDGILDNAATDSTNPTSYPTESVQFLAQPDVPRGLTFKPSGPAAAGGLIVEGLDYEGKPITEEVATNAGNKVATTYAFKKVTKITFPADSSGISWDVGWGDNLGLPLKFASKPLVLEYDDGVLKTTTGTITIDADVLAKNTYAPNATVDEDSPIKLIVFL